MGLYYFLLMFIGIAIIALGIFKVKFTVLLKTLLIIFGLVIVIFSILLLMPGSIYDIF